MVLLDKNTNLLMMDRVYFGKEVNMCTVIVTHIGDHDDPAVFCGCYCLAHESEVEKLQKALNKIGYFSVTLVKEGKVSSIDEIVSYCSDD